ncbi:MAG: SLC13 family permease [Chloroflexota bacterium]|nr:SLC13 family permease [Chloroflexota bacterium]
MSTEIISMLFLVIVAMVLFSLEKLPTDLIAMGVVLALALTGLLPPEQAFAGFGSDTVVMIFGLLVLTRALVRTGVADNLGKLMLRLTGDHEERALLVISVAVATLSALMSNTASTALFIPITIELARRLRMSSSKLLLPLAFASILASSITLVSTSTNIVISGLLTQYGLPPIGMFELAPVGIPVAVLGVVYMVMLGHRLIPNRTADTGNHDNKEFGIHPYLAELLVLPGSPFIGKTLIAAGFGRELDLTVLRVVRDKTHYLTPRAHLKLEPADELLVRGHHEELLEARQIEGLAFKADIKLSDPRLQTGEMQLAEVILLSGSPLIGRTLRELRFRQRYGMQTLGINRHGKSIFRKLSQTPLQIGDRMLIQGRRTRISILDANNTFQVLGAVEHQYHKRELAPWTIGIFAAVLILAALNVLSLPVAVLTGTLAVFLIGSITPEEAYHEIAWETLIVIGSMLALGAAMQHTGTAEFLATRIVGLVQNASPTLMLSAFFFLSLLLTQPMSNQAAAVLVVPIAIQTAQQLGLNPRTFVMMIAVGASCSFITPLEPACLMVYSSGDYRFTDFIKVGSPLTILVYLIAILLVPVFWPI